ncbi:hypothetical protein BsWGS_26619 [Bradybaena similaris]
MEATTQTEECPYPSRQVWFPLVLYPPDAGLSAQYDFCAKDISASAQMPSQGQENDSMPASTQPHQNSSQTGFNFHLENNSCPNGFNCCQEQNVKISSVKRKLVLSNYLIALRPWSFTVSIIPVALGSCLAYKFLGVFDVYVFLTTIFTAVCVHAAGNLVNTYFDFMRGIDNKKSDDRTLVDNILSPNDVVTLGALFYISGCVGFLLLNFISSAKMEHLALIYFCGLSGSFLYTGGLGLKYIALGDIIIVLTFGPVAVVFSHLSQTGQLSFVPLIYAIPLALNTEAILHTNNTRDMDSDHQAGVLTLAILLGKTGSYCLFCLLLFVPYLIFLTIGIHYSMWMLLPAVSILLAFPLEKSFRRGHLETLPHEVAKLNLIMGVLYIIAVYLAHPQSLPSLTPLVS